jgi:hypothetical protein
MEIYILSRIELPLRFINTFIVAYLAGGLIKTQEPGSMRRIVNFVIEQVRRPPASTTIRAFKHLQR